MKVAVVGSGCAGLGATWALNEHSEHQVHLYEADTRPGGHANTVPFKYTPKSTKSPGEQPQSVPVDTGFIVLNPRTYPNFLRFLHHADIPIVKSSMTFALTRDNGAFEWAGDTIFTLFCQPRNLLSARMWRMIWDILRFNASARKLIVEQERQMEGESIEANEITIGEYLDKNGYSDGFRDDYLIPMCAAIWSTPPSTCAQTFTARSLLRFFHNHHLLQIIGKPDWLTIKGGSIEYVKRITNALPPGALRLSEPVVSISTGCTTSPATSSEDLGSSDEAASSGSSNGDADERPLISDLDQSSNPSLAPTSSKIRLCTATGRIEEYDHVVLACHSSTALEMLRNGGFITPEERSALEGVGWTKNEIVLHSDVSALPHNQNAWSAWNFVSTSIKDEKGTTTKANSDQFALSYLMNTLQPLPLSQYGPIICTLNPTFPIAPDTIQARFEYAHPTFNNRAEQAQRAMKRIQGKRGIWYAGAWMGYGFHEDGFTHGLKAAIQLATTSTDTAASTDGQGKKSVRFAESSEGVHLPFEIRAPDRSVDRVWLADVFEVLERARRLLSFFLFSVLFFGWS